jgi:hypothetical protein
MRNFYFFCRYNSWICTQCRKAYVAEFGSIDETEDPLEWLYEEIPSTAGSFLSKRDSDYEPADNDISQSEREKEKREFKEWLASTDYQG